MSTILSKKKTDIILKISSQRSLLLTKFNPGRSATLKKNKYADNSNNNIFKRLKRFEI